MLQIKRKLLAFIFVAVSFLSLTTTVHAQQFSYRIPNPSSYDTLEELLNAAAGLIRPVFILTFGAMVIYGGWVRLTSKGDPDKIASSSKIIMAAITGFAIAVLAPSVVNIVTGLLDVEGLSSI